MPTVTNAKYFVQKGSGIGKGEMFKFTATVASPAWPAEILYVEK